MTPGLSGYKYLPDPFDAISHRLLPHFRRSSLGFSQTGPCSIPQPCVCLVVVDGRGVLPVLRGLAFSYHPKTVLKPVWTHGIELWGCASKTNSGSSKKMEGI